MEDRVESDLAPQWETTLEGNETGAIEIPTTYHPGAEYWIDYRLIFGSFEYQWTDGPYFALPLETIYVQVEVPGEAYVSDLQKDYTSRVVATVKAVDSDTGEVLRRRTLEFADVVFLEDGTNYEMMTASTAEAVAPAGVYSLGAQALQLDNGIELEESDDGIPSKVIPFEAFKVGGGILNSNGVDDTDCDDEEAEE